MLTNLLITHALSSLHAGTGQGIGVIDLPIAREKATALPFLPGSSMKGSLRDLLDQATAEKFFGPATNRAEEYASAVQFSDQRLLLLPVRSLKGTFAWVTSPYILKRFKRDATDAGKSNFNLAVPTLNESNKCLVTNQSGIANGTSVYLEDLDLTAELGNTDATNWANEIAAHVFPADKDFLTKRFCIVSDDVMGFLADNATEVAARIRLDDNAKTVADGGLWYEEALPCETLLYGIVIATEIRASGATPSDAMTEIKKFDKRAVQFGGKATVGCGVCRLHLS